MIEQEDEHNENKDKEVKQTDIINEIPTRGISGLPKETDTGKKTHTRGIKGLTK